MDFSHRKKMDKLTQVSIRLPVSIRQKARRIVEEEDNLTESDVYRFIIVNFFDGLDTSSQGEHSQ